MQDVLTDYMYENLSDFGTILAADGKAIQSFAPRISQKDSGNLGEHERKITCIIQLESAKEKIESGTTSGLAKHCA